MQLLVDPDTLRQPDLPQFTLDGWIDAAPFERLLGLEIVKASAGRSVLTLPFKVKHSNGGGVMHGGAMTTLADTAVAMAIKSVLPQGTVFATTELKMAFLAPVVSGQVIAHALIKGPEGRTFYGECELRNEDDIVFARFSSVFRVARNQGFDD